MSEKPKPKKSKWKRSDVFSLVSLIIAILSLSGTLILGISVYFQNETINSLSRGYLANDVLVSSLQQDTLNKLGVAVNLSIDVTSNYDGAIPIHVVLLEVQLDGAKIASDYKHVLLSKEENIIEKDSTENFEATFEAEKPGEYTLNYILYYDYNQEDGYQTGKTKTFSLNLVIER